MNIPDIWSILTGTAGLVSLFLSIGDRFSIWRKFTIPAAAGFGGFAAGRLSPVLLTGIDQIITNPRTIGFILIFLIILAAVLLITYSLLKRGETIFAFLVFTMGMVSVPTAIIPMYSKTFETVPAGDLAKLGQLKIEAKEYEDAIRYFGLAKENTKNEEFRKQLDVRIKATLEQEANSLSSTSNN